MTVQHLKYILKVAEGGSITEAAKLNFIIKKGVGIYVLFNFYFSNTI